MTEFKTVPIDALRPCPWNTNIVSPANQAKLDASLKKFGLFTPLIVRRVRGVEGFEILGGEHRWEALKRAGYFEVAIADQGLISDEDAKSMMLAANARYGADDALALAELLKDFEKDFQDFLPYSDADIASIFSSDIALDELDLIEEKKVALPDEEFEKPKKAPKTHTMIRFKLSNEDAERITELIERTKHEHGFTEDDDATNAGDALVELLLSGDA